jgi:hypothetical protein
VDQGAGPVSGSEPGQPPGGPRDLASPGRVGLGRFPATLVPNPLVRELAALGREAGEDLPWVEELAADVFMGRFSAKYLRAAQLAGRLLAGSLYARCYDIDYSALPAITETGRRERGRRPAVRRSMRCAAGAPVRWAVAVTVVRGWRPTAR